VAKLRETKKRRGERQERNGVGSPLVRSGTERVSISVLRGVKAGRHVREHQRPTSITPKGFQAHKRFVAFGSPKPA
jgi:hypothetical protein